DARRRHPEFSSEHARQSFTVSRIGTGIIGASDWSYLSAGHRALEPLLFVEHRRAIRCVDSLRRNPGSGTFGTDFGMGQGRVTRNLPNGTLTKAYTPQNANAVPHTPLAGGYGCSR